MCTNTHLYSVSKKSRLKRGAYKFLLPSSVLYAYRSVYECKGIAFLFMKQGVRIYFSVNFSAFFRVAILCLQKMGTSWFDKREITK